MTRAVVLTGNNLDHLARLPEASVDAICCDPPYGMAFMGRNWDKALPDPRTWAECFRVLKPGGHMVAFGAPRLYHRLAVQIEDSAPWELRDCISWLFGSGFPKSHDVSKAIDKIRDRASERRPVCRWLRGVMEARGVTSRDVASVFGFDPRMADHWAARDTDSQPSTPKLEQIPALLRVLGDPEVPPEIAELLIDLNAAKGQPGEAWFRREVLGRGSSGASSLMGGLQNREGEPGHDLTAPATEAAAQWEGWGTALKPAWEPILLARKPLDGTVARNVLAHGTGAINVDATRIGDAGRWPANLILDEEAGAALDAEVGELRSGGGDRRGSGAREGLDYGMAKGDTPRVFDSNSGGPSRFFYCAKASRSEREAGLDDFTGGIVNDGRATSIDNPYQRGDTVRKNRHPTVKPIDLMRYLVRLITPPDGIVVDPFTGSGTTGAAAVLEGFQFLGMELDPDHAEIARARIAHWTPEAG